jgi:hypothetical protein
LMIMIVINSENAAVTHFQWCNTFANLQNAWVLWQYNFRTDLQDHTASQNKWPQLIHWWYWKNNYPHKTN